MYFTPIQLHAVQVYMNYHFIKTCRADCFDLSVMSIDLFNLFMYCMFCLLMSGLVIFTLENFVFSGCAFFVNMDYSSSICDLQQLISSNKELFQVREGNSLQNLI